jgi:hypothetical protein
LKIRNRTRAYTARIAALLVLPALVSTVSIRAASAASDPATTSGAPATVALATGGVDAIKDSLLGRSGKLRARLVAPRRRLGVDVLAQLFGDSATKIPGVYSLQETELGRPFSFITLIPFESKVKGRVDNYRMGFWPGEVRKVRSNAYENPTGFIRVTPENQDTRISEHFRLRDFLTHDQAGTWPKYLVLREDLLDKLELVIDDLSTHGVKVTHMSVMSGFRTPQYNALGVGAGGRAKDSRHQYGDAADVFVDNDRNGRMDDLNRDGRVDARDAAVVVAAMERVELAHPDLVGGGGIYRANRVHGPFAHVDVRGYRARWGNN